MLYNDKKNQLTKKTYPKYAPNNRATKDTKTNKSETRNWQITTTDRTTKQKISKDIKELNNTIN